MGKSANMRWYDKNPELSGYIEYLRDVEPARRDRIIGDLKNLIQDGLIDDNVMEFPLTTKRRWYDSDPYAWLIINAMKYADEELLHRVIAYLRGELSSG